MNADHTPGQWPAGCNRPSLNTPPPRLATSRKPSPVTATAPAVHVEITLDLSSPELTTSSAVEAAVISQLSGTTTGAHVRIILGETALADVALPRLIAGRCLEAESITVVANARRLPYGVRLFAAELGRQCGSVLADHVAMVSEGWA